MVSFVRTQKIFSTRSMLAIRAFARRAARVFIILKWFFYSFDRINFFTLTRDRLSIKFKAVLCVFLRFVQFRLLLSFFDSIWTLLVDCENIERWKLVLYFARKLSSYIFHMLWVEWDRPRSDLKFETGSTAKNKHRHFFFSFFRYFIDRVRGATAQQRETLILEREENGVFPSWDMTVVGRWVIEPHNNVESATG